MANPAIIYRIGVERSVIMVITFMDEGSEQFNVGCAPFSNMSSDAKLIDHPMLSESVGSVLTD